MHSTYIETHSTSKLVKWDFNTIATSWCGGVYEIIIFQITPCLKKLLAKRKTIYEELQTPLCQAESILNKRSYVFLQGVLTPNYLLYHINLNLEAVILLHIWKNFSRILTLEQLAEQIF